MRESEGVVHGSGGECYLEIVVTPGAKREEVGGIDVWRKRLEVKVAERAVENRANLAVLRLLEDFFGTARGSASIARGAKGRRKTVRLGLPREEAEAVLKEHGCGR